MLVLAVITTRLLVGLMLAATLSFGLYLISIPIVTSIWRPEVINGLALTILTTSIGASIGGFIAWFERERNLMMHVLLFALMFGGAFAGAYIGLLEGIELMPNRAPWQYGLPILSNAIKWAVIGANVSPLALAVYKSARSIKFR